MNRLSDFLFILARKINIDLGIKEITWSQEDLT
jgi:cob(I)alamin adenosyltransferase